MLLRRFAKIPVGIFAFVAASSAVGHSSEYNLSSCLSRYDLHLASQFLVPVHEIDSRTFQNTSIT